MASVVHCFTHAQMKDKMEGEELSIELYEDTAERAAFEFVRPLLFTC